MWFICDFVTLFCSSYQGFEVMLPTNVKMVAIFRAWFYEYYELASVKPILDELVLKMKTVHIYSTGWNHKLIYFFILFCLVFQLFKCKFKKMSI